MKQAAISQASAVFADQFLQALRQEGAVLMPCTETESGDKRWEACFERLQAFRSLPDDYDGGAAEASKPAVFDFCQEFVQSLRERGALPAPMISPNGEGGALLVWQWP